MPKSSSQISVVVTVKNDALALQKLLSALDQQSLVPDQIIITIAESTDDSWAVANQFTFSNNIDYQVINVGRSNRSQGRNLGVSEASGQIIVFTDAGCWPSKTWLENLVQPIQEEITSLVSGFTWGPPLKKLSLFEQAQLPFVLVPLHKVGPHPLPATRNMAIRADLFKSLSGFNENLNWAEDYELARRLKKQGISSLLVAEAKVFWQPRPQLLSYATMIWHLTVADIKAGNWRLGHATMWARYLFFVSWSLMMSIWISVPTTIVSTVSLIAAYLLFKVSRFDYEHYAAYGWAVLIQLVTDLTVLVASFYGLVARLKPQKN